MVDGNFSEGSEFSQILFHHVDENIANYFDTDAGMGTMSFLEFHAAQLEGTLKSFPEFLNTMMEGECMESFTTAQWTTNYNKIADRSFAFGNVEDKCHGTEGIAFSLGTIDRLTICAPTLFELLP